MLSKIRIHFHESLKMKRLQLDDLELSQLGVSDAPEEYRLVWQQEQKGLVGIEKNGVVRSARGKRVWNEFLLDSGCLLRVKRIERPFYRRIKGKHAGGDFTIQDISRMDGLLDIFSAVFILLWLGWMEINSSPEWLKLLMYFIVGVQVCLRFWAQSLFRRVMPVYNVISVQCIVWMSLRGSVDAESVFYSMAFWGAESFVTFGILGELLPVVLYGADPADGKYWAQVSSRSGQG